MKMWGIMIMAVLAATAVSATTMPTPVYLVGTVYEADMKTEIAEATVSATCNKDTEVTKTDAYGDYFIDFTGTSCMLGDMVTVTATYNGASASVSDSVKSYKVIHLAIVNVSVPEFATVTALAALAGGAAILYFRRKK
jgi:hypothetical protein